MNAAAWVLLPLAAIGSWWTTLQILSGMERLYRQKVRDARPDQTHTPGGKHFPTVDHEAIALLKSDPEEYFRQCREGLR